MVLSHGNASTLSSKSSTMLLSSWNRDMALEDDDFLNLDDLSGVAGARGKGVWQVAEVVAEDRQL